MSDRDAVAVANDFMAANRIETMRVLFTDIHGLPRAKVLPVAEYLRQLPQGFCFSESIFAKDVTGRRTIAPHLALDSGARDCVAVPDPDTYCILPWQAGRGQVLADLLTTDGGPLPYSPRWVLRHVLALENLARISPVVASELEFYLLARDSLTPIVAGTQAYGPWEVPELGAFWAEAMVGLEAMRLPVATIVREGGPGMFEISLHYTTPIRMADYTVLLKIALREIASRHNLMVTFMPKPFEDEEGSGFHLHQSIWDLAQRVNLFVSEDGELPLLAQYFIGGQLAHLPAGTAFFVPSVNGYKRLRRGAFSPVNCTWGYDNRTTALRVPYAKSEGRRVEHRVPGADGNPYLVFAVSLACGALGMRERALPPPPVAGDASKMRSAPRLPGSLRESLSALASDHPLIDVLGADLVRLWSLAKSAEQEEYERHVSTWERSAYLEAL